MTISLSPRHDDRRAVVGGYRSPDARACASAVSERVLAHGHGVGMVAERHEVGAGAGAHAISRAAHGALRGLGGGRLHDLDWRLRRMRSWSRTGRLSVPSGDSTVDLELYRPVASRDREDCIASAADLNLDDARDVRGGMKLLFSTRPAYGHMYPLMPLAEAAHAAGHEVLFASCDDFVPKLERLGYRTASVGISIDTGLERFIAAGGSIAAEDDERPNLAAAGEIFINIVGGRTAAELLPVLERERPDAVIYEQYEFGAAVAAGVAGIQAICHSISPQLPLPMRQLIGGPRLAELWGEHGVSDAPFDATTGNVYLDIFPTAMQEPSFAADPSRVPMQPIPWAEPGLGVPAWVTRATRPVIYLTLGTVVATDEVLVPAIEGLAALDADVLVTLGSAVGADLGRLPANVRVESFVDQAGLLPYVDLVVHHGGSGTVLGALVNGVPQVITPKGADQFLNGDLIAAAGLAEVLLPSEATADAVAIAAMRALSAPNRKAIDAARDEIAAMPTPTDVVAGFERRLAA